MLEELEAWKTLKLSRWLHRPTYRLAPREGASPPLPLVIFPENERARANIFQRETFPLSLLHTLLYHQVKDHSFERGTNEWFLTPTLTSYVMQSLLLSKSKKTFHLNNASFFGFWHQILSFVRPRSDGLGRPRGRKKINTQPHHHLFAIVIWCQPEQVNHLLGSHFCTPPVMKFWNKPHPTPTKRSQRLDPWTSGQVAACSKTWPKYLAGWFRSNGGHL